MQQHFTWKNLTADVRRKSRKCHTCQVFTDPRSGDGGAVWIDTVGYDDTGNKDDEEIFRNILKFIQSHDLTKVTERQDHKFIFFSNFL